MRGVDLSVIILSYNTRELLKQCMSSITNYQLPITNYEIIVVDNASTDGSVEFIKSLIINGLTNLKLIRNKKNLGFARANNQALRKAKGRYILILNPDTVVSKNTLSALIQYLDKHPKVGVVTCRVELPDGSLDDACHRGFPTPWNAFCHFSGLERLFPKVKLFSGYSLSYLPFDKIHEIDSPMGAFYMVRSMAVKEVGLLDEDFFWYGEDLDWSYRFKEKGWKIVFYPHVKILHYHGASSGIKESSKEVTTGTKETRRMAVINSIKAMRIFYNKYYKDKYPKVITWLVNLGMGLLLRVRLVKDRMDRQRRTTLKTEER